jgi:hypothetical protein
VVEQRRASFVARAEAHRQASLARRADTRSGRRLAYSAIVSGTAAFAVRPIEPADGDRLTRLLARMSPESRRLRFFGPVNRLSARDVEHFVNVNHSCREALVAIRNEEIVGVARYHSKCGAEEPRWQWRSRTTGSVTASGGSSCAGSRASPPAATTAHSRR